MWQTLVWIFYVNNPLQPFNLHTLLGPTIIAPLTNMKNWGWRDWVPCKMLYCLYCWAVTRNILIKGANGLANMRQWKGTRSKGTLHSLHINSIQQPFTESLLWTMSIYMGPKHIFSVHVKIQLLELHMDRKENLLNLFLELTWLVSGRLSVVYTIFNL